MATLLSRSALVLPVLLAALPSASTAQQEPVRGYLADSTLALLAPMIGHWRPLGLPDSLARLDPPIVALQYRWTVGAKAIRIREGFRGENEAEAQLDGLVYWNPATERIEFVAVAGHDAGQGRLFVGEYRELGDGTIERTYDVFYRTLADIPGEELGGSRRRYRETYRVVTPDSVTSTLDWFHDGAWQGFGPFAEGAFARIPSSASRAREIGEGPEDGRSD